MSRLFDTTESARAATRALKQSGFRDRDIAVITAASGRVGTAPFIDRGVLKAAAKAYAAAVNGGRALVIVDTPVGLAGKATRVLDRAGYPLAGFATAEYEGLRWDEAAPLSAALHVPVLWRRAAPLSALLGLPTLSMRRTPPARLPSANPAPLSSALHLPTLAHEAAPLSALFRLPVSTRGSAPIGFGLPLLSRRQAPAASGVSRLSRNPAPLSSLLHLPVLVRDEPS